MPKWTPEQEAAIQVRDKDILVSAAAGAGKTSVLVQRIVQRLLDPADPADIDRMLVVTFTEAAASEMRERIGHALEAASMQSPTDKRLQRQLSLLHKASISTLHAFCLAMMRRHFYELDLDPGFRVGDADEVALLKQEVLQSVLEARYRVSDPDDDFYQLVAAFGGRGADEALQGLILDVYDYSQSLPAPAVWLHRIETLFDFPADTQASHLPWVQEVVAAATIDLERAASLFRQALDLAESPNGPAAYGRTLEDDVRQVEGALRACSEDVAWDVLRSELRGIVFARLPGARKSEEVDAELKERAKGLRDEGKKLVLDLAKTAFNQDAAGVRDELLALDGHAKTLVQLERDFSQAFSRLKQERGIVDFTDLERATLDLLQVWDPDREQYIPSPAARQLQAEYDEVLVDEYQDINPLQDRILALVSRDRDGARNRFMVGDVKQSIYRFRLADPGLFLQKYTDFAVYPEDEPQVRIDLQANFRSSRAIVDGVNYLFRHIMTGGVAELSYDRAAALVCGATYGDDQEGSGKESAPIPVECHIVERDAGVSLPEESGNGQEGEAGASLAAAEREAAIIARRIRDMVDGGNGIDPLRIYDKKARMYRPVTYRDIAVLMRSTRGRANVYADVFRQFDIPVYAELGTGYFAATEIETVLALLQIIDNPRQDIPLAAVLHSPVVGLDATALSEIRAANHQGDFFDAACRLADSDVAMPAAERVRGFLAELERWRTAARRKTLSELIWQLLQETGYYDFAGGMPGGVQRQANLRALYDRGRQFDGFSRQGLFRFLRFIENLREGDSDLGEAPALSEEDDVVRIMSIHKSKGLEFPVVFVAELGKRFNLQELNGDVLYDKDLGFGPMSVDPEKRVKRPTLAHRAVQSRLKRQALAEEMRILYVAVTRARERLILVGSTADLPKAAGGWMQAACRDGVALDESYLAAASSCLDWIGASLARHPDARVFAEMSGIDAPASVRADDSCWHIRLWGTSATAKLFERATACEPPTWWSKVQELEPLGDRRVPEDFARELEERLNWQYPHKDLVERHAKTSVTELKRRFQAEAGLEIPAAGYYREKREDRPRFMQEKQDLTAAERGIAMHTVLQHLDLRQTLDPAGITGQVQFLVDKELLTTQQAQVVDVEAIAGFFRSPLGQRVIRAAGADRIRRELSFTLGIPPVNLGEEPAAAPAQSGDDEDVVLLQGTIDCLIEDDAGYVLVDFKTDSVVTPVERLAEKYRVQMILYARAVEAIFDRPVIGSHLYFLSTGDEVRVG